MRSFVQLIAVGYVIQAIFDSDSLLVVVALLAGMVGVGTVTARGARAAVPRATVPVLLALARRGRRHAGAGPGAGRVPGHAALPGPGGRDGHRQRHDRHRRGAEPAGRRRGRPAGRIEATLALGATAAQATKQLVTRSLRSAMIPLLDQTKTTGLVSFPGVLVGSLVAGAEPVDAVRLQLVLLWILLGAVALAALIATSLGYRGFFTSADQLREP